MRVVPLYLYAAEGIVDRHDKRVRSHLGVAFMTRAYCVYSSVFIHLRVVVLETILQRHRAV